MPRCSPETGLSPWGVGWRVYFCPGLLGAKTFPCGGFGRLSTVS